MLNTIILKKNLTDIEIKIELCKTNFQWKILAQKFEDILEQIEKEKEDLPQEILDLKDKVRQNLVEKKGELPDEDLVV